MRRELEVGQKKLLSNVSLNELLLLAKEYQVSLSSVIMRLHSLGIIDDVKKKIYLYYCPNMVFELNN